MLQLLNSTTEYPLQTISCSCYGDMNVCFQDSKFYFLKEPTLCSLSSSSQDATMVCSCFPNQNQYVCCDQRESICSSESRPSMCPIIPTYESESFCSCFPNKRICCNKEICNMIEDNDKCLSDNNPGSSNMDCTCYPNPKRLVCLFNNRMYYFKVPEGQDCPALLEQTENKEMEVNITKPIWRQVEQKSKYENLEWIAAIVIPVFVILAILIAVITLIKKRRRKHAEQLRSEMDSEKEKESDNEEEKIGKESNRNQLNSDIFSDTKTFESKKPTINEIVIEENNFHKNNNMTKTKNGNIENIIQARKFEDFEFDQKKKNYIREDQEKTEYYKNLRK